MVLMRAIRKAKQRQREMRLLILGLDNAGKTTVLKRFNGEDISEVSPTLGFQIKTLHFAGYALSVWDVGGQSSIRAYWRNFFEQTDGLVWVVDSTDAGRLAACREELHALLKQERLSGAPLLVLYNKADVEGAWPLERVRDFLGLQEIRGRQWALLPSSALTGSGLLQGMRWLVNSVAARLFTR